jgi:hypothetical protein
MTAMFKNADSIVEVFRLPLFDSARAGLTDEEKTRWDQEIRNVLTDEEKDTGVVKMIAYIGVATK